MGHQNRLPGSGWYHLTENGRTYEIQRFIERPHLPWYGPFPTFTAAKRGAQLVHRESWRKASRALREVAAMKFPRTVSEV